MKYWNVLDEKNAWAIKKIMKNENIIKFLNKKNSDNENWNIIFGLIDLISKF